VGTLGRAPVIVRESFVERPFISFENDTSRLRQVWNQSLYVHNDLAPSFLMRFEGNLSPHPQGISSLVDTKRLDSQDLVVRTDRGVVDYVYFGLSSSSTNRVVNMPAEFVLDDDNLVTYDAVGKTT